MRFQSFFSRPKQASQTSAEERRTLLYNLEKTKRELDMAHLGFQQSTDPDLVEFYLFEVDALRARHSYLLRRIKEMTDKDNGQLSSGGI